MTFSTDGYELLNAFIPPLWLKDICNELDGVILDSVQGGIRNAEKKFQTIKHLAQSNLLRATASHYVGGEPALVRAILFDKTPSNNWLVSWHQDKSIAVSTRIDVPGWCAWSVKDGCLHVQPTMDVLDKMVTFRIHLDEARLDNGCLRVIPGSHQYGLLSQAEITHIVSSQKSRHCPAQSGSALIMRPHLLHASSKATLPSRRRVIHLEYCSYLLPEGLTWATSQSG